MITIASIQFDLNGHLILKNTAQSDTRLLTRRATRTATLDGLATSVNFGVSDSDRTLTIQAHDLTNAEVDQLLYLFNTYPNVKMTTDTEVFTVILSDIDYNKNPTKITALVMEKLNE